MSVYKLVIAVVAIAFSSGASSETAKVMEGIQPKWVLAPPVISAADPPKDALIQVKFLDTQVRVSRKGQETYIAQRFKFLRPEALQAANLRFAWQPTSGQLTVHSIRLYRKDGSAEEMLSKAKFQIIQREENLEQAVLTGITTAVFATPGVEVGDEIEFSATIFNRDPTLGDRAFGLLQLPALELGGTFRARVLQSDGLKLNRKTTADLDQSSLAGTKTPDDLVVEIDNPKSANLPEGAPGRYGVSRLVEFSSFSGWPDVSTTFWKQFEAAARINPASPVRAEIAKIAAASTDPEVRTLAALKLVQDRIRYVFVGFGTGNYTPASADETWQRRYGDCKGKAALLLAILKELGIAAEPVLVNQGGVDGIGERLASPGSFDHVLVRVTINKKTYWLDGTLFGSPKFDYLPQPVFRAALPLRAAGSELESIVATPLELPSLLDIVDIDARAGTNKPAHVSRRRILQGQETLQVRAALASLSGNDLKQALHQVLGFGGGEETVDASWIYDEPTGALTLKWIGEVKLDWQGDSPEDQTYYLPGAGFSPPSELKRPKEQDQNAPWAVIFPDFRCWVTTIQLPPTEGRTRWDYVAKPVNRALGGIRYFRQGTVRNNIVQTVMSKRALQAELSSTEAAAISTGSPKFDNAQSYVYQRRVGSEAGDIDDKRSILETANLDWLAARQVCQAPVGK